MKIGRMIKILREHLGLTQAELARVSGVTQSYISRLEQGEPVEIRFRCLMDLLIAFETLL